MTGLSNHPWFSHVLGDPEVAAILSPEAELARMLRIEAAWSRAIAPAGRGDGIARMIETASITPQDLAEGTGRDGMPVPALVHALKAVVPVDDHQWVHRGLTSQDVIDTALTLALSDILPLLSRRIMDVMAALDTLDATQGGNHLMAYTRMQAALPIQARDRIAAWRRPLSDLVARWPDLIQRCCVLQYGGPVGVRDPSVSSAAVAAFAKELAVRDPGHAWHNDRTRIADLANALSAITGTIGKFGQDVALMAQAGEMIALSGGGSSSAMPHKQNPVRAEICVALARQNASDLATLHHALLHEQERSGAAWTLEWLVLPRMLETTGASLRTVKDLLNQIDRIGMAD